MMTACPMCEPFPHPEGVHFVVCEGHRRRLEEAPMLSPERTYTIPGYTVIDVRPCEEHGYDCPDGPDCWTCCECDGPLDDLGGCPNERCAEWRGLSYDDGSVCARCHGDDTCTCDPEDEPG